MEPHDCSILYAGLHENVKRALKLDETLLPAICEKLKSCEEHGRTLSEFRDINGRFIWIAMEKIANSQIDLPDQELNAILYALFHHRTDSRVKPKPILKQLKAVRENITKYLVPSRKKKGYFKHALLDSCIEKDPTKFNDAVAKIVHRFPASDAKKTEPLQSFNNNVQELTKVAASLPATDLASVSVDNEGKELQVEVSNSAAFEGSDVTGGEATLGSNTNVRPSLIRKRDESEAGGSAELSEPELKRQKIHEHTATLASFETDTSDMTQVTTHTLPTDTEENIVDFDRMSFAQFYHEFDPSGTLVN